MHYSLLQEALLELCCLNTEIAQGVLFSATDEIDVD